MSYSKFDILVIGGGHAGVEAALAASRMGCQTAMVTLSAETIGQMSCNPAIGGVGKGQLVREIDCLGGEMGLAADRTAIQFRQLNSSKGQAVRSSRCQSDRKQYKRYIQEVVKNQDNLTVIAQKAGKLLTENNRITGIQTESGAVITAQALIITTGTFLNGRIHVGKDITPGGRVGEQNSVSLADSIRGLGFKVMTFKTGTPPRLDGRTIDFSVMEEQPTDKRSIPFSFRTPEIPASQKLLPCWITYTTAETHRIIMENMDSSPMYSGQMQATGVRYCPSIEDKLKKFAGKDSHHVFLEPEGLDTDEFYPNGISTGLPADIQERFVRSIPGLENVKITCPGYAIEHGVIPPTSLKPTLETKLVKGLYLAGQINGTTGYEEAGAQGLMAGINAVLAIRGEEPFILGRHEAYIGVLIDDLTTKGTEEPYRMFTSRVEYRLIVREDNTDQRLAHYGRRFGLISAEDYSRIENKYELIAREIEHLRNTKIRPGTADGKKLNRVLADNNSSLITQPVTLSQLLKRPEVNYHMISPFDGILKDFPLEVIDQVEYEIKYEGFILRHLKDVEKFKHIEVIRLPEDLNYDDVPGLSIEVRQKLKTFTPATLGAANRISGMTPAAISILMVYLRKRSKG